MFLPWNTALCHPTATIPVHHRDALHLLSDTTFCTGTPQTACTQLEHSQGVLRRLKCCKTTTCKKYTYHSFLDMLVRPIHLYLSEKLQHNWNNHTSFPRTHRTLPSLPQDCYTGPGLLYWMYRSLSNPQNFSLSLLFFFCYLKQMLPMGGNKFYSHPISTALLHLDFNFPVRHVLTGLNLLYLYYFLLPYALDSWKIHFLVLAFSPTPAYVYLQRQLFYASLDLCILL